MAGPFDFVSPGAAFTDALTQQLAQRKADERQQLIDSIAVRAEQRAQQESDSMKTYRDQEMALAKQNAEREQLNTAFSHLRRGADLSHMDPDLLAIARKYNMVEDTPIPQTSAGVSSFQQPDGTQTQATDTSAAAPTPQFKPTYVGAPQEQFLADQQKNDALLANGLLSDPDPTKQMLGKAALQDLQMNNGVFSEQFRQRLGPGVPVATLDPYSMKLNGKPITAGTMIAPGTDVFKRELPPPSYTDDRPHVIGFTEDNFPVLMDKFSKITSQGKPYNGPVLTASEKNTAIRAGATGPGTFNIRGNDPIMITAPAAAKPDATAQNIADFKRDAFRLIGQIKSPHVRQAVTEILRNPRAGFAALKTYQAPKNYTQQQVDNENNELASFLNAIGITQDDTGATLLSNLDKYGVQPAKPTAPIVGK